MECEQSGGAAAVRRCSVILLLDTSTSECRLTLIEGDEHHNYAWQANRELAHGLLRFIDECLARHDLAMGQLGGLGVLRGPGSFTGLRIGITTLNTIADSEAIPIVGVLGENWQDEAARRLLAGEDDTIVLPEYGREARITKPRK